MKYLLDVDVPRCPWLTRATPCTPRPIGWYASIAASARALHTCSITELGFVRVSVVAGLLPDIPSAKTALAALQASSRVPFALLADDLGAADLPVFVKGPQAVTDGHLIALAKRHSVKLVSLDRGIPGALIVP